MKVSKGTYNSRGLIDSRPYKIGYMDAQKFEETENIILNKVKSEFCDDEKKAFLDTLSLCKIKEKSWFFANLAYESNYFSRYEENLYYTTPERVLKIFRVRLKKILLREPTLEDCKPFVKNPENLANTMYANRYGNGGPKSGDGYRYRGMSAIQTTFKNNHEKVFKVLGKVVPLNVLPYSFYAAGVYWVNKELDLCSGFQSTVYQISGSIRSIVERVCILKAFTECEREGLLTPSQSK